MFYLPLDTITDTIPLYLKAGEMLVRPNPLEVDFGRFEYLPLEADRPLFAIDSVFLETMPVISSSSNIGVPILYPLWMQSLVFLLFVACFVLFSLVFRNSRGSFWSNFKIKLFFNQGVLPVRKMQVTTAEIWGEMFLITQSILIISIFAHSFLLGESHAFVSPKFYVLGLAGVFLGISLLVGVKYLLYRSIGAFFLPVDIKRWIGLYYRHLQLLGLLLFLPVLICIFLPEYRSAILYVILFLFLINRLVVAISLLNIFVKNKVGLIYYFSYLCGIEIAPYVLFYKGAFSIVTIAGNYLV